MKQIVLLLLFLALTPQARAQEEEDEPLFDRLQQVVKQDVLSFGALFQVRPVVMFGKKGPRSINLATARLSLRGGVDAGISYYLQFDVARSQPLLDLRLSYRAAPGLTFHGGLYKAHFSGEYLTSSSALDFVQRARIVEASAPKRQVGFSAVMATPGEVLTVRGGIFNGTTELQNEDEDFLYVGRVAVTPGNERIGVRLAANAGYERVSGTLGLRNRLLAGGDARVEVGGILLAGEVLYERGTRGTMTQERFGYYATLGVQPHSGHQVLARLDALYPRGLGDEADYLYVLGYNVWPTSATKIQVNYLAPAGSDLRPVPVDAHGAVVNLQLSF